MNILKFIYRKSIPLIIRKFIWNFLHDIRNPRFSYTSFGTKNPDRKFLVLGNGYDKNLGLFAIVNSVLVNIRYCIDHNIALVVDLQNNDNQYLDDLGIGKENSWEYFFEQPFGYNLEYVKDCKNILLSSEARLYTPFSSFSKLRYFPLLFFYKNFSLFQEYKNIFKQYIKLNKTVGNYINFEYERIFRNKERVLGVLARGTDFFLKKPKHHHVQPEPDLILEKAKQTMRDCKCDYIYLATEDECIYKLFRDYFGNRLLVNNQKRVNLEKVNLKENELLSAVNFGRKRDKYNLGLEYLSSIYNLSKCQCFVGGITSGTIGVFLMTEGFEYQYLFDLGVYT